MTQAELEKLLQDAINRANNANTQLGGQPSVSPVTVTRPTTRDELSSMLDNAITTYKPVPIQPVQVTAPVEQPKQNIFQKAGSWISGVFKKYAEQDTGAELLKPILEDKQNKLIREQQSNKPREKKINELNKEIQEIQVTLSDTSPNAMGKKILLSQKYGSDRNIQQFKGAMVGLAKSIFDSLASLYEQDLKSKKDFANKQEELIKQGFKDLNIPESEQQALMEKYSPRFEKDFTTGKSLADREKDIQKAIESGREPFQKTMERYIEDVTPTNPDFSDQLVQGLGSMAGFYVATILTGGGAVIPSVLESMGEAGTVYEENKKNGMSINDAFMGSTKTFVTNLVWNALLNKFSGLFENIGEPAIKEIKKKVAKIIQSGTFEGIQEAGQQLISNINTGNKDIWEGVFESLGLGAIIGSGAMGVEISTGVDVAPTTEVTDGGKPTQQPSGTGGNTDTGVIEDKDKEDIRTVFHGTKGENIPSILESGFKPSSDMVDFGTGIYLGGQELASVYGDLVQADVDFNKLKTFDSPVDFIEESAKYDGIDGLVEEIKKTYGGAYIKSKDTYVIYDKNIIKNIKQVVQEEIATETAKKKGIQQPKIKKDSTGGIVEPQIKKAKKAVSQQKQGYSTDLVSEAKKYSSAVEFVKAQQPVYHGSTVPLKRFSNKRGGVFFTDSMEDASGFGGSLDNVYEGYLNFNKPLVIDAKGAKWDKLNTRYGKSTQEVINNAQKDGYDGVIFKNVVDNIGDTEDWGGESTISYAYKPQDSFINESQMTDIWNKANNKSKKSISSKKTKVDPVSKPKKAVSKKVQVTDTKANETRTPKTIEDNEQAIRDTYKKNEEKVYDAMSQIFAEMEIAEAGQRIFVEQYDSSDPKIIGISSTFPKWIPEDLRSRELFDKVLSGIVDIDGLKYPTGNRTAQRALYDAILEEIDSRSGVDTSKYRSAIIDLYEKPSTKQTIKAKETVSKRIEGGEKSKQVSKEKPQEKQKFSDNEILSYVKKRSVKLRTTGTVEDAVELARKSKNLDEFIKAYETDWLFHGSSTDLGDNAILKTGYGYGDGQYTGQDMGGLFFTPSKKYALQYANYGENSLYRYKLPKDVRIFDIRNAEDIEQFIKGSSKWTDYDSKETARQSAIRMVEDMKETSYAGAVDWATASQYLENIRESGFDGARFLERRGEVYMRPDGSTGIKGDPIYSYAIISMDEIPVQRALTKKQLTEIYDKAREYESADRELLTFHNIRTEGLQKADKMGGIPVPSLAITKSNIPFESFGEVTLVGGKEFAYDDVFTSDAYTRRVPRQQYEINQQEKYALIKEIEPYLEKTGEDNYRGIYSAFDSSDSTPSELIRKANDSNTAKAMFLKEEMGIDIGENLRDKDIAYDISHRASIGLGVRAFAESEKLKKIIRSGDDSIFENVEREDLVENPEKYNRAVTIIKDLIDDTYKSALTKLENVEDSRALAELYRENLTNNFFLDDGTFNTSAYYNFTYQLNKYIKSGSKEVDKTKVDETIAKHFEKIDQKAFDSWVMKRFGGIFGRSYFYDNAGRKKAYSLENIMSYMTGRVRGQENFFYGAGSIKSRISKKLTGADQVVANKELLLPESETKKIHDDMQDELGQLIEEIKDKSEWRNSDSFGIYDQIGKDLATVGTNISTSKVRSALHRAGVSDPSTELVEKTQDYLKRLQSSPVNYFETKPQRVVKISEFKGALIPNDIDPEIKKILQEYGLKVVEYDPKVEFDRSIKAQLNFKGEMFRVKDDVKRFTGRTITDAQEKEIIDFHKKHFGNDNVKITLQIMANQKALGSYRDAIIQIVDGQADPKATYYHEAGHYYLDTFTTSKEQIDIFREGVEKYGTTDLAQVEENVMEDFITFAKDREGATGKLRSLFDKVIIRIKKYLNMSSAIEEMYSNILSSAEEKAERIKMKGESMPVGTGKVQESALFKRTREQLLMYDPGKYDFDDTTGKYNTLNLEKDAEKAVSFLEKNPDKAIAVGLGVSDAPAGQTANGIGIATALKARDEGNFKLYTEIMNSVSLRSTRMGQEIVSLRGQFNDDSAENYVKRVIDARMNKLAGNLVSLAETEGRKIKPKKEAVAKIQKETAKVKDTLSKEQNKIKMAQDIIDAMRC